MAELIQPETDILKGKKCLCESCEECNFWRPWTVDILNNGKPTGQIGTVKRCIFAMVYMEMPGFKSAVRGAQSASEQTRNRYDQMNRTISKFGRAAVRALRIIANNTPKLLE